jgi:hypothetical protein
VRAFDPYTSILCPPSELEPWELETVVVRAIALGDERKRDTVSAWNTHPSSPRTIAGGLARSAA